MTQGGPATFKRSGRIPEAQRPSFVPWRTGAGGWRSRRGRRASRERVDAVARPRHNSGRVELRRRSLRGNMGKRKASQRKPSAKETAAKTPAPSKASPEKASCEVRVRTFSPGFLLHSPSAVASFVDGQAYYPPPKEVAELFATGRFAVVSTGSPELDYVVRVQSGPPSAQDEKRSRAQTRFLFRVTDGELVVRDGYALNTWGRDGYACESVPFADGEYQIDALWIPSETYCEMPVELYFTPHAFERVNGSGWADLDYVVD